MGSSFSSLFPHTFAPMETRILMLGLDGAGKTTILYKLKLGKLVRTIPTIGYNVEHLEYKNVSFTVWDVAGRDKLRLLWRHYYKNTKGVIFVVNSSDCDRMDSARDELELLLKNEELKYTVLLVFANKQDLQNAMSVTEIAEKLRLKDITQTYQKYHVQACCATTGEGLYDGMDWLSSVLFRRP